jgi:hypothetical protein
MIVTTYRCPPCPAIRWMRLTVGLTRFLGYYTISPEVHADHCTRKVLVLFTTTKGLLV